MNRILAIDDEEKILEALTSIFKRNDYEIMTMKRGDEAIDYLCHTPDPLPDLILLDVNMPLMDGFIVAQKLKKHDTIRDIPIIFLAALIGTDSIVKAFESGGVDYISKPFNIHELMARINTHIRMKNLVDELKEANRNLEEKTKERERMTMAMVSALEDVNFYNDSDTGNHIRRMSKFSAIIAEGYGCDQEFVKNIHLYASLHDIGKVGISDELLKKPGRYTPEEFEAMKKHVAIGGKMLSFPEIDQMARNIVLYHHEKWDGTGYLRGLQGEEIPLEARIVALADVYDALLTKRVYKEAYPEERADAIILRDSNKHFDPAIVDVFFRVKDRVRDMYHRLG